MADTKISALPAATTPLAGTEVLPLVQGGTTDKVSVADLTAGRAVSMLSATAGNVQVSGNTVSTTNTNGNLIFDPNGSGFTIVAAPTNGTIAQLGDTNSRTFYFKQANVGGFDNDTLIFESDSGVGQFQWKNSGATLWTMTAAGNLAPATSGKGIDFSATPGTGTSELLADYEEGTWTPIDGSGAGLSFTSASGRYTKIGRMVTVYFSLVYPATASASAARVGGLPFTSANTTNGSSNGCFNVNTSAQVAQPSVLANATNFAALITNAGISATNANLTSATLQGGVSYFV